MTHIREWAREMLVRSDVLIFDTETTGLNGEIIEIGLLSNKGEELLNVRLKPIEKIHHRAEAIHGLTADVLANEPDFSEIYPKLKTLFENAHTVLIYNAIFDRARLDHTCAIRELDLIEYKSQCVMLPYSEYIGEWNDYHGNYRWQKLPGGDHSAIGDCRATLDVLSEMAGGEE